MRTRDLVEKESARKIKHLQKRLKESQKECDEFEEVAARLSDTNGNLYARLRKCAGNNIREGFPCVVCGENTWDLSYDDKWMCVDHQDPPEAKCINCNTAEHFVDERFMRHDVRVCSKCGIIAGTGESEEYEAHDEDLTFSALLEPEEKKSQHDCMWCNADEECPGKHSFVDTINMTDEQLRKEGLMRIPKKQPAQMQPDCMRDLQQWEPAVLDDVLSIIAKHAGNKTVLVDTVIAAARWLATEKPRLIQSNVTMDDLPQQVKCLLDALYLFAIQTDASFWQTMPQDVYRMWAPIGTAAHDCLGWLTTVKPTRTDCVWCGKIERDHPNEDCSCFGDEDPGPDVDDEDPGPNVKPIYNPEHVRDGWAYILSSAPGK
jgi:hypothetical protein